MAGRTPNPTASEMGKRSWQKRQQTRTPEELREQMRKAGMAGLFQRWMRRKTKERQNNG